MRPSTGAFSSCLILLFTLFSVANGAGDNITRSQTINDGQTLVSAAGTFELGFFSPPNSSNRYLGIWFAVSKQAVVWIANRDTPLADSTGVLAIDAGGNLLLTDGVNRTSTIWSSGVPNAGNTVARLLDSGNLVLQNGTRGGGDDGAVLWQSFDYPSDTLLPGMKLGLDFRTGINRTLTSWRNPRDPAAGGAVFGVDTRGMTQLLLWNQGSVTYRTGPWNGLHFSGIPEMQSYRRMFNFTMVISHDEAYYQFGVTKPNVSSRLVLTSSGVLQRLVMDGGRGNSWYTFWFAPKDQCDGYAYCGPNGACDMSGSILCSCLPGFRPRNLADWNMRDGKGGCVRKTELNCSGSNSDGFVVVRRVRLPDTVNSTVNASVSLGECREVCLKRCSCTAYAAANITGAGSGCVIWTGDLTDIRSFPSGGQELYLRLAASEIDLLLRNSSKRRKVGVVVSVTVVLGVLLLGLCAYYLWRKRERKSMTMEGGSRHHYYLDRSISRQDTEIPLLFEFDIIASATNNFSTANIIGEGGFGIVYKGNLDDGQEIAIKRLSLHSLNGVDGFKNEVKLIAKLQHRNLVRLLGCCIRGDEWMLIYEYMPNKSLDGFIFDEQKCLLLDWRKRLDIILGVARGLLYLHQDSRLRIIHRDLKVANILLDQDMNPRISDFGTARIFRRDQSEVTQRIVGTYGYMSPEYAMDGVFSVKSDVFSFGVLTLEIITGRKNRWISPTDSSLSLLAHIWKLWKEDDCSDLLADALTYPCPFPEVLRFIQVGLLCVQASPYDRPTMQEVVLMLVNENSILSQPKPPGFFTLRDPMAIDTSSNSRPESSSMLTMTNLEAR